ncbi:RNA-directed DNA polymerase, eukaryota [Artemisia annua]|uniref:RNA-directed DNA polymerase, eukaryota n=1 Tax=Artemisia annua TaxID=35608 RepID=A0A2U1PVP7_ARTAN|nr:RNA-directed DNA polymerase, eukaryota [Artemisia annua]
MELHKRQLIPYSAIRRKVRNDAWEWDFGDEESVTVRYVRCSLEVSRLSFASMATHWCKILPIKVNVFVWRAMLNRLPTCTSLGRRGIDIESLLCQCCNNNVEDSNHVFFTWNVALELWNIIALWLDLHIPEFVNMADMFQWIDEHGGGSKQRRILNTNLCYIYLDPLDGEVMWLGGEVMGPKWVEAGREEEVVFECETGKRGEGRKLYFKMVGWACDWARGKEKGKVGYGVFWVL